MIEDAPVGAISCSLRGFSEEVIAAGDNRHTVDADHQTRTLTLWRDLCLDVKKVPRVVGMEKSVVSLLSFRPV